MNVDPVVLVLRIDSGPRSPITPPVGDPPPREVGGSRPRTGDDGVVCKQPVSVVSLSGMSERARVLSRGSDHQLLLGIAGLAAAYALELVAPAGWPRAAVAATGALGFAAGASGRVGSAVAAAQRRERLPWIF